ncbi:hypothetical protein [Mycobacterium deserti]|uniref:Facilitated glucose transporter n=1 Tax=Mycobacterium deserti TaxID=2978347 RepID=A0ABT2M408_9MYCO|nr:hypothetical protein [Mycobacterium deserti]MCT7656997.1 hypothetical protein [Mycobacterium deserti]
MGDRLGGGSVRQHPDLTAPALAGDRQRVVVLTLLALDGVLSAIAAAFFLPAYLGTVPFPISALLSGLVNAALVWAATHWTSSPGLAGLPVWCWLLTVAVFFLGGPGDDIVFGGAGAMQFRPLLLIVLGMVPAAAVLRRRLTF